MSMKIPLVVLAVLSVVGRAHQHAVAARPGALPRPVFAGIHLTHPPEGSTLLLLAAIAVGARQDASCRKRLPSGLTCR
jgi:hypothetical protein